MSKDWDTRVSPPFEFKKEKQNPDHDLAVPCTGENLASFSQEI